MKLVKSRKIRNGYKLELSGELSIFNANNLKDELAQYLDGNKRLTLNLSDVSEADTAFLQMLLQFKKECSSREIDLDIDSCSEPVAELISIYDLNGLFDISTKQTAG